MKEPFVLITTDFEIIPYTHSYASNAKNLTHPDELMRMPLPRFLTLAHAMNKVIRSGAITRTIFPGDLLKHVHDSGTEVLGGINDLAYTQAARSAKNAYDDMSDLHGSSIQPDDYQYRWKRSNHVNKRNVRPASGI